MKKIYIIFMSCVITSHVMTMNTTYFKPCIISSKPQFTTYNLTSFDISAARSIASQSYNPCGQKTVLLSNINPEPLLKKFIDDSLAVTDDSVAGYALFNGKYSSNSILVKASQNIHQNFFIQAMYQVDFDALSNISIIPTNQDGQRLTQQEIQDQHLDTYLEKLTEKLYKNCPTSCSKNEQKSFYQQPLFFMLGYCNSFNNFNHLDFIDVTLKTGLVIPLEQREQCTPFSILPHQDQQTMAIPFEINTAVGFFDWLNIGGYASILCFIPGIHRIPLNNTNTANYVIIPQFGPCKIHQQPKIVFNAYIGAEHLIPRITLYFETTFVKQYPTTYQACDTISFPSNIINQHPTQRSWSITYFTFSAEYDPTQSNASNIMPRCKFIYSRPITGRSCFASQVFAGQFGIEIKYDF